MGLGSRTARRHDTEAQRKLAGVRSEDYWDHRPGDRVMTCDGIPGVVTAVLDGFSPGAEEYEVRLDGGLGGGKYASGQLRGTGQVEANTVHTADIDYPELRDVLRDRPDPALDHVLAKQAAEYSPEIEEAELVNPGISQRDPELAPDEVEDNFEQHTASSESYAMLAEAMASGASDDEVAPMLAGIRRSANSASPWGEPAPNRVEYQPGPTSPRNPDENPCSAGPLTALDPSGWHRGPLPTRVTPLESTYATLHEAPEPALPTTDGADDDADAHEAALHTANPALLAAIPELLGAGEAAGAAGRAGAGADLLGELPGLMGGGESHDGGADQDEGSVSQPKPGQTGEEAIRDPSVTSRASINLEPDLDPSDDVMTDLAPKAASAGAEDEIVARFQATAAGRSMASGMQRTALKDFSAEEQRQLINEGQGVRAANLDRLDVTGTHYAAQLDDEESMWLA